MNKIPSRTQAAVSIFLKTMLTEAYSPERLQKWEGHTLCLVHDETVSVKGGTLVVDGGGVDSIDRTRIINCAVTQMAMAATGEVASTEEGHEVRLTLAGADYFRH
jgi:hypothetical protein